MSRLAHVFGSDDAGVVVVVLVDGFVSASSVVVVVVAALLSHPAPLGASHPLASVSCCVSLSVVVFILLEAIEAQEESPPSGWNNVFVGGAVPQVAALAVFVAAAVLLLLLDCLGPREPCPPRPP